MRSLRDTGGITQPSTLDSGHEYTAGQGTELCDTDSEFAGLAGYYAGLIAAARSSLPPGEAAALVRRLRNEKIMVMRAAKDRRRMRHAMLRHTRKPAHAHHPRRQFG
jgi:hypothetical protein